MVSSDMLSSPDPRYFSVLVRFLREEDVSENEQTLFVDCLLTHLYARTVQATAEDVVKACNRLLALLTSSEEQFAAFRRRMRALLDDPAKGPERVFQIVVDEAAGDAKTRPVHETSAGAGDPTIERVRRQVEENLKRAAAAGSLVRRTEAPREGHKGCRKLRNFYALPEWTSRDERTPLSIDQLLPMLPEIPITAGVAPTAKNEPPLFAYAEVLPGFLRSCLEEAGGALSTSQLQHLVVKKIVPPLVHGLESLEQPGNVDPEDMFDRPEIGQSDPTSGRSAADALPNSPARNAERTLEHRRRLLRAAMGKFPQEDCALLEKWLDLASEGLSLRAIARQLQVAHTTLDHKVKKFYKIVSELRSSGEVEE